MWVTRQLLSVRDIRGSDGVRSFVLFFFTEHEHIWLGEMFAHTPPIVRRISLMSDFLSDFHRRMCEFEIRLLTISCSSPSPSSVIRSDPVTGEDVYTSLTKSMNILSTFERHSTFLPSPASFSSDCWQFEIVFRFVASVDHSACCWPDSSIRSRRFIYWFCLWWAAIYFFFFFSIARQPYVKANGRRASQSTWTNDYESIISLSLNSPMSKMHRIQSKECVVTFVKSRSGREWRRIRMYVCLSTRHFRLIDSGAFHGLTICIHLVATTKKMMMMMNLWVELTSLRTTSDKTNRFTCPVLEWKLSHLSLEWIALAGELFED